MDEALFDELVDLIVTLPGEKPPGWHVTYLRGVFLDRRDPPGGDCSGTVTRVARCLVAALKDERTASGKLALVRLLELMRTEHGVTNQRRVEACMAQLTAPTMVTPAPVSAAPLGTAHVFISYSRKDSAFVNKLEAELNARGIQTWRDQHNIPGGMAWYQSIVTGLDNAYAMICVVSPDADLSRWVLREQLYGDERRIPRLPVLMQPHRIPFHLIETQPINCANATFATGVNQLVAFLKPLQAAAPHRSTNPVPLPVTAAPLDTDRLRTEYLRFLLSETVADLRDALYVNLTASAEQARPEPKPKNALAFGLDIEMLFDLKQLGLEAVKGDDFDGRDDDVDDARQPIRDYRRVVLLGEPGAGKTTTLLKLVVDYARAAQADSAAIIPVFVPLREFNGDQPFAAFVRAKLGILQEAFGAFQLVFMLDALNEMPRTAADGRDLVAEVRDFLRDQADWVVSCRVRDYQDDLSALAELGKVRIKQLDLPQIREFITRYYTNTPGLTDPQGGDKLWHELKGSDALISFWNAVNAKGERERFWDARAGVPNYTAASDDRAWNDMQRDSRRLLRLCRNPYMLTMICGLFGIAGQLPPNRGALFQQFVGVLLRREAASAAQIGAVWLDSAHIRRGLAQLAYALGAQTEMPRVEAEQILKRHLPAIDPALLLRCAVAASLVEVGADVRFTHQLLQEYFASEVMGALLDAKTDPTTLWKPDGWWQPTGREETVIILAGVRGDPEGVARWLAPAQPELALQVLTDSGIPLDVATLDPATRSALIAGANGKTSERDPRGRAAAYRALDRFDADKRPGVGLRADGLPDIVWCEVNDKREWVYQDKKHPALPPYRVAKYPVTYIQFQAFIDAPDGWHNPDWWRGLDMPDGHNAAPGDQAFKFWNHPREGVSWYDAVAFCRWLSAKRGEEIRLPTEQEWERAARGTDGREYPYSGTFDAAKGNTRETGIGQTSAVGIFPDGESPVGALDMSGNVWEWCLNKYGEPSNVSLSGTNIRVLRGGSWFDNQNGARAAFRNDSNPHVRFYFNGFRVCCRPY
jgi:hypothetical protein